MPGSLFFAKASYFSLTFTLNAGMPERIANQWSQGLADAPIDYGNPELSDLIDFYLALQSREAGGQLAVEVGG